MCVHIKPEVKKNDTIAITIATNEACIGWWDKKLLFHGEGKELLIVEDAEFIWEDFSGGEK